MMRLSAVLACALIAAPAAGSVVLQLDLARLTEQADGIERGRVVDQTSRWNAARTRIYTDVTVAVDRAYKGDFREGATVVVTRLGGSVDGIGMRVAGEARFAPGEEVILFLRRHGPRARPRHTVLGMAQGKLVVIRDAAGARVLASAGAAGLRVVTPDRAGTFRAAPRAATVRPLGEVERDIGRVLSRSRAAPRPQAPQRPAPTRPVQP